MYTIYGGNLHNSAQAAKWFQDRSPATHDDTYDIALLSEVQRQRARRRLCNVRRHTYFTGPPGMGDNNAGRETGILLAKDMDNLGGGSYFLSPIAPGFDHVGQERWGQVRVTRLGRDVTALINLHPTPKPSRLKGPADLLERNEMGVSWAYHQLTLHTRLKHHCVIGVDINVRREWETSTQVRRMIDRHHLKGLWVGRDLLMVTPGLRIAQGWVLEDVLPDHPLLKLRVAVQRES